MHAYTALLLRPYARAYSLARCYISLDKAIYTAHIVRFVRLCKLKVVIALCPLALGQLCWPAQLCCAGPVARPTARCVATSCNITWLHRSGLGIAHIIQGGAGSNKPANNGFGPIPWKNDYQYYSYLNSLYLVLTSIAHLLLLRSFHSLHF